MDGYEMFVEVLHGPQAQGQRPLPPPPPPDDNTNNTTSSLVLINVKAGRTHLLKKMEFLHSKKALMDKEMTWVEGFQHHFNYRIDPNEFLIQKFSVWAKNARRHELTAQIKEMLPEFPKNTKEFKVYLVTNNSHVIKVHPLPPIEPPPPKIPWWNKDGNLEGSEVDRAVQSISTGQEQGQTGTTLSQRKGWPTPLTSLLPNTIIVEDKDDRIVLRATLKGKDEWLEWLTDFQKRTNTKWNVKTNVADPRRYTFMKDYTCHHSSFKKRSQSKEYRSDRNAECKVQLKVRVKIDTRFTRRRDKYIELGYPCVINLIQKYHSHPLDTEEALSFLRPTKECEETFLRYYKQGVGVSEARVKNEERLKDQYRDKGQDELKKILNNGSLNPKARVLYNYWTKWKKEGVERRKEPADRRTRDGKIEAAVPEDPMPDLDDNDPPADVDMEESSEPPTPSPPGRPTTPPLTTTSPEDLMLSEIGKKLSELTINYGGVDTLYNLVKAVNTKEDWEAFLTGKRPGMEREVIERRRENENEVRERMMGVIIKPLKTKEMEGVNIPKKKKPITRKRHRKHLSMLIKEEEEDEWTD